ncbi:hypothetical protein DICPUDRAFT_96568 [Dictyostelium purpureum]|uniref:ILEI/PANDER domain-containing protein n=1 Tax=Dictyostelium purpureum TaxID=5786 RepID=F0Z9H8_DICPU|nr:uncharacterized protein DICPUDRAFT_96568 [Dictyostelium purpureum]EGC39386.1 hypothetical protein DICPUDRAFT_96568 [Dictyostelium purpureum]|eukprot:XP_003284060.1 hypothetical protein DICPUDRAFT_96568 [Dictyostelium purpureum]
MINNNNCSNNKIDTAIYFDNNKLLDFKVKDVNTNLEKLRESLGDLVPYCNVFIGKDGPIDSEQEEFTKVSDVLIGGAIHFKTQDSISRDAIQVKTARKVNAKSHPELANANTAVLSSPIVDATSCTVVAEQSNAVVTSAGLNVTTTATANATNVGTIATTQQIPLCNNVLNEDGASKMGISLKNINVEENRKKIFEYCKNLPLKYSIDPETFQDRYEIVQWDLNNALIFPPQETLSFMTKSTFNSIEHNAHKGGLYTWNGTMALKSIFNFINKGQVESEKSQSVESKTVYSYTHGMIPRLEIRIEPDYITLKDNFIKSLGEASKDLGTLKQFLKNNEFFPTRYTLGGKISSTGYKKDCAESDKESFGFTLENRFKFSFHDPIDLDFGFNVDNKSDSGTKITGNYLFDEKRVSGGDRTLKDDFGKYILSLENIQDCSIIEIGNLCSIWTILKNQNRDLHDKCINLLNSEAKTVNIQVYSSVETNKFKGYSKFIINGKEIDCGNNQGFNVVILDSKGLNLDSKSFNTSSFFFFINSSKKFTRYLKSIKDGKIILLSVNGDGFSHLSEEAQKELIDLGIDHVEFFESNSSFCAILKKGDKNSVVQNSKDSSVAYCEKKFIVINKN